LILEFPVGRENGSEFAGLRYDSALLTLNRAAIPVRCTTFPARPGQGIGFAGAGISYGQAGNLCVGAGNAPAPISRMERSWLGERRLRRQGNLPSPSLLIAGLPKIEVVYFRQRCSIVFLLE
jgi:hypothetical protein